MNPAALDGFQPLLELYEDGVVLAALGTLLIGALVVRQVRAMPRGTGPALLAIVLAGALLRALIARPMQMEGVYAYMRVFPLASQVFDGPALAWLTAHGPSVSLPRVIFGTNFLLAVASPVVLFAHAGYVLRDARSALLAAALVAFLPSHIRFSCSDASQVQSFIASSLTFTVLYAAVTDRSTTVRTVCLLLLPLLCVATYTSRQENLIFYPIDAVAIFLSADGPRDRARRVGAFALVTAAAVLAFAENPRVGGPALVNDALGAGPVALAVFLDPRRNTLLWPGVTPPFLPALALLGAATLARRGALRRALLLAGWFGCFFAVQSFAVPETRAMQTRYHLQLLPPIVLLAAASAPVLAAWSRRARVALGACVVAAPLVYLAFERDVDFYEMREFAFLEAASAKIPDGCTVLEFRPQGNFGQEEASRLRRVATRVERGERRVAWHIVDASTYDAVSDEERLSDAAGAVIADPPACLFVYEGLTCRSHRPLLSPTAPVCDALRGALDMSTIDESTFRSRGYDVRGLSGRWRGHDGVEVDPRGVLDGSEVRLGLYRASRRAGAVAP